jgi:hypothetical protein
VTSHEVRVLEDGTRVYSNGTRYTPVPDEERRYARRKPADSRAVRWGANWYLPLALAPEAARQMPQTRPDEDAYDHMPKPRPCRCDVCKRPAAAIWKDKWRRDRHLRS